MTSRMNNLLRILPIASIMSGLSVADLLQDDGTCLALVMGGGANNGAWEAGVLYGLINYGDPQDFQYDVVAGVSVGGINSFGVSLFPKGEEVKMVDWISSFWLTMSTDDVWQ